MPTTEECWLDYAWSVVNCHASHRKQCEEFGAAVPGAGRVDGNEVRWPGYLGRNYRKGVGILCVGAVHREARLTDDANNSVIKRTNAELVRAHRHWLRRGRSQVEDLAYLEAIRIAYADALPHWSRWRRHFRTLVQDYLGMSMADVAWTNLAKCRVAIHLGNKQRSAEARLTRLCQREFVPIRELIEAICPALVLTCVLNAKPNGDIVSSWDSPSVSPLVFSWQGQSGHDRHNRDPLRRKLSEWAPEMVDAYRGRMNSQ